MKTKSEEVGPFAPFARAGSRASEGDKQEKANG
jgi:hypothetical protein